MRIHIEELRFDTIIGLLESERLRPQTVIVDLLASYSFDTKSNSFINYAEIVDLIKEIVTKGEFKLLESALEALQSHIKKRYPQIEDLEIKITKPDILNDCKVAVSKRWHFSKSAQ